MHRYQKSRRDDDGVVALELVLVLPFLLMLLVGILVLGNFLSVKGQASNWARDAARQAALPPHTFDLSKFPDNVTLSIGSPCPIPPNPEQRASVTVRATMPIALRSIPLIPTVLPSTLTQEVTMRCNG